MYAAAMMLKRLGSDGHEGLIISVWKWLSSISLKLMVHLVDQKTKINK